jgi:uncharacterized protein (DUF1697 family)
MATAKPSKPKPKSATAKAKSAVTRAKPATAKAPTTAKPKAATSSKAGEPMVAFLRGVNLGKRTVKSADLKAAFVAMGYPEARTLIASGNVLFTARPSRSLAAELEIGLEARFGFPIAVVLRTRAELRAMIASAPFAVPLPATARPHGVLFAESCPPGIPRAGITGDYDIVRVDPRELFLVGWVQPEGGMGKLLTKLLADLAKDQVSTARAWNTLVKAAEPDI